VSKIYWRRIISAGEKSRVPLGIEGFCMAKTNFNFSFLIFN